MVLRWSAANPCTDEWTPIAQWARRMFPIGGTRAAYRAFVRDLCEPLVIIEEAE